MDRYVVEQANEGVTVYGGNLDYLRYQGPEALVHGAAETGKSYAMCLKIHLLACKYPRAQLAIIRKTQTSCYNTILQTYMNKILGPDLSEWPCEPYGGTNRPERFNYSNGSVVFVGGMDKSSKILSSEFDVIALSQAEELTLDDWETLTTRTTGRAGHMPYAQTIGDANPAYPTHWMYKRSPLRIFYSHHKDNPALYNPETGEITVQGQRTMSALMSLTGLRRVRLYEGKAAQAEGVVYDGWNDATHLLDDTQMLAVGAARRYICGVDWGYTNPGVIQVWHLDGDDRMYLVYEVYRTKQLIGWWVAKALEIQARYQPQSFLCDPSEPGNIAEFRRAGLPARKAKNAVSLGIQKVEARLKVQADGLPRLFIVRDCLEERDPELEKAHKPLCTADEFPAYVWQKQSATHAEKEEPVKVNDHGCDCVRMVTLELDRGRGAPMETPEKTPSTWGSRGGNSGKQRRGTW